MNYVVFLTELASECAIFSHMTLLQFQPLKESTVLVTPQSYISVLVYCNITKI